MAKKLRWLPLVLYLLAFAWLLVWLTHNHPIAILQPRGTIAHAQFDLLAFAFLLSMVVIIPVYILLITFAWKYRESRSKKNKYTPDADRNNKLEIIWWGIPCAIILVLSIITWRSSHSLDPFRPIASTKPTMSIQVVALDWKWLFIYPEQHMATVNYVELPVGTPVDFSITADAPMNSFWIPQLAGQIYAMPGMETHLHIVANTKGTYSGSSANISGQGFSDMAFKAQAVSDADFATWTHQAKSSPLVLDQTSYATLAKPSRHVPASVYGSVDSNLYDTIVLKYMMPAGSESSTAGSRGVTQSHAY